MLCPTKIKSQKMKGYLRKDKRKGIRNCIAVAYLVECAHHVARQIVSQFDGQEVHLIGFSGCAPNEYAHKMMKNLCTHPNIGAVLLVSLGCENFNRDDLAHHIALSGRPVEKIIIQESGGTLTSVQKGKEIIKGFFTDLEKVKKVDFSFKDLIVRRFLFVLSWLIGYLSPVKKKQFYYGFIIYATTDFCVL